MAVCSFSALLREAEKKNCAVGAFNVGSMEMLMGVLAAAEETGTPMILQIAEKRLRHSPLELMGPMMVSAARAAKVPVAVHLDHGSTPAVLRQAMDMGFTSVMFDGSALPLAENIAETRALADEAHARGVEVEAEIGVLGGSEGGPEQRSVCTDPKEAEKLAAESGCDALAVAIGNSHGHYKGVPKLRFDVLEDIRARVGVPLVLHGGTGIPAGDFRRAISLGVRKINIATANFDALTAGAARLLHEREDADYFALNEAMVQSVKENALRHLSIFQNR